jgi:hypothetical protein
VAVLRSLTIIAASMIDASMVIDMLFVIDAAASGEDVMGQDRHAPSRGANQLKFRKELLIKGCSPLKERGPPAPCRRPAQPSTGFQLR